MTKKLQAREISIKLLWIAFGQFLAAVAFDRILLVNNLVATGLGGLATVINHIAGLNIQVMLVLLALPVFGWAFFNYDKKQIFYASFSYFIFTFYLGIVSKVVPAFKTDPIIAAVAGGILLGVSAGVIMKQNVANGPESVVGLYMKEKRGVSIGTFFLIMNTVIIFSSILYGNLTLIIYSIISTYIQSKVTDYVIVGGEKYYAVNIISDKFMDISEYIRQELHRGVTFVKGMDTSNVQRKMLIQTVVSKHELIALKGYIKTLQDDSFVYASESAALIGRGFDFNL